MRSRTASTEARARVRLRGTTAGGLTLALEIPPGIVRDPLSPLWRPVRAPLDGPQLRLGVRLRWPAPEPGPLPIVRELGARGRIAAEFSERGVVIAELREGRALRVLRLDGALREGIVECAPEVLAETPVDPLGPLGPVVAHHRLAREGAASLLGCLIGSPSGTLVFASASSEIRSRLARRLAQQDPDTLWQGGFVVRSGETGPNVVHTPWTRVWSGRPGRARRVWAWHAVHAAPTLLAEPLHGRRAADALAAATALLPGDEEGLAFERAVIERLVVRDRVVRLGCTADDRLVRYVFGRSGPGPAGVRARPGAWGR